MTNYASGNAMDFSRRSFLAGSAALGAAVAAGAIAECVTPRNAFAAEEEAPAKNIVETVDVDIAVLGGGWSGLAAAVEAVEAGANVILIETTDMLGGTGTFTEGMLGVGSSLQAELGIEMPNINDMVVEEQEYAHYYTNFWQYHDFFSASGENVDWMIAHGVEFGEVDNYLNMGKFDVFHWWKEHNGAQAMQCLADTLEANNADIRFNTRATELILNDEGGVAGVYCLVDGSEDEYLQINCKAAIIATGGVSGNEELMRTLFGMDTTYCMGALGSACVGDGYNMAMQAGAARASICTIEAWQVVDAGSDVSGAACNHCMLMVNEEGLRFMREDLSQSSDQNIARNAIRTHKAVHTIFDADMVDYFMNGEGVYVDYMFGPGIGAQLTELQTQLDEAAESGSGSVFKADSLDELAEKMGVDADVLAETVATYNGYCEAGEDADFGTDPKYLRAVANPPFYACRLDFGASKSIGGYRLNRDQQLMNEAHEPIPGLYGAGMDGCNLFSDTYNIACCGGNSGYCCYSGRHAAQKAIESL